MGWPVPAQWLPLKKVNDGIEPETKEKRKLLDMLKETKHGNYYVNEGLFS